MTLKELLKSIHPATGDKYSPNLHQWVRRAWRGPEAPCVYRGDQGVLYIGEVWDDGWFCGAALNAVLCNGSHVGTGAYGPSTAEPLRLLPGFWEEYIARGRCVIDPEHQVSFIGDTRWKYEGDTRTCQWCGEVTQVKRTWHELVERSRWMSLDEPLPENAVNTESWRRCDDCKGDKCAGGCAADQPRDEHSDEFEGVSA